MVPIRFSMDETRAHPHRTYGLRDFIMPADGITQIKEALPAMAGLLFTKRSNEVPSLRIIGEREAVRDRSRWME
jgi:hypothetical protein